MTPLQQLAEEVGTLVALKRDFYGDSISSSDAMLTILFGPSIPAERFGDVLLIARVLDKLQRLAHRSPDEAESPWLDIAGYAICGIEQQRKAQEIKARWQGSVNGPDVPQSSSEQPGSAAPPTNQPTTPRPSESDAPPNSQLPGSSSPQPTDATAPGVLASASANEAAHDAERRYLDARIGL